MTSDDLPVLAACSSSRGVGGLSLGYVARQARIASSASRTSASDRLPRPSVLAVSSLLGMRQLYARGAGDAGAIAAAARFGEAEVMTLRSAPVDPASQKPESPLADLNHARRL